MEKIINLLSEIEGKATTILDHTAEEKQQLHQQLDTDIEKFDRQIQKETEVKVFEIHSKFNDSIEVQRQQLIKNSDEQIKKLQSDFKDNHDALVAKVFCSIVGA